LSRCSLYLEEEGEEVYRDHQELKTNKTINPSFILIMLASTTYEEEEGEYRNHQEL
jgi:hypothetical protein